jgi:DNA invertase Pin-like site-specific DNA recombinase
MSTEHQQYSAAIQSAAIRVYAEERGFEIVRTYADEGRSGLTLAGRPGLLKLLHDIDGKTADFDALLVYDVSRLGRFQDPDEAASHELHCRKAGVAVHYCAEQFENDGSIGSSIIKALKRAMASEYSRELSVKVYAGQAHLIRQGFRQGGSAGIGLRRMLIDKDGAAKGVLRPGDQKNITSDRVILIPGPPEEQALVREIFELFTAHGMGETAIAKELKARGCLNDLGRPWSREMVHLLLVNEKYIGNNVWGRHSFKLQVRHFWTARDQWVRSDGAFDAIVERGVFDKAQAMIRARLEGYSDAFMLQCLREVLSKHGDLSRHIIDECEGCPSSWTYRRRFGGMLKAYALIGFTPAKDYAYLEARRVRRLHRAAADRIIPRFYFHLHNSDGWTHDNEGRECEGDAVAGEAFREARKMIAANVLVGASVLLASFIAVDDSDGQEVHRVTFREALTLEG